MRKGWYRGVRKIADPGNVKGLPDPSGIVAGKFAEALGAGPDAEENGGYSDCLRQQVEKLLAFGATGLAAQEFVVVHNVSVEKDIIEPLETVIVKASNIIKEVPPVALDFTLIDAHGQAVLPKLNALCAT
jgi:hypothetical protein